jgi:hypothetical protein
MGLVCDAIVKQPLQARDLSFAAARCQRSRTG